MRRLVSWVRAFFGFSRRETNAFLILLPLMFILIFSEPAYRFWFVRQPHDYSKESEKLDSLIATMEWREDSVVAELHPQEIKYFSFNPNLSSKEELMKLGFNQSLANRVVNYRMRGGKFFTKSDLLKIYGMDSMLFNRLNTFINLPEKGTRREEIAHHHIESQAKKTVKLDLNIADTSEFIKVYGVGSKLSARIAAYREKLGGFVSEGQLNEVYGLDSSVVKDMSLKFFIADGFQPKKININKTIEKDLGAHPYIKYKLAKAIVAYRKQHGLFSSIEDIKRIGIIDENAFRKMSPYLSID